MPHLFLLLILFVACIYDTKNNRLIWKGYRFLGESATNNQAEYAGLLMGLEGALQFGFTDLIIQSDSELLVNQIKGIYKVKSLPLKEHYERAIYCLLPFFDYFIESIPRELNTKADSLANLAMNKEASSF